ncbi:MAG: bifunctional adenosylcobinamide kinase/adenosylcobinamide-phosphate guanylyltransferase [Oscillospiraceae bacterium]|nr:bifunctional adenosylcobinamide kinase/adenosylcobinamide-phosphate guanylyltransferase [Oscillospiraceae bacterium]
MILVIGGAYQGKLDYAKESFGVQEASVFRCTEDTIDFSKTCITELEQFTLACTRSGRNARAYLEENREKWENSVILCQDLFCGVVPLGAEMRAWRQETGRLLQYLSREAAEVHRVFCGLGQRLK